MQIKDYSQTLNQPPKQSSKLTLETLAATLIFLLPAFLLFIFAAK